METRPNKKSEPTDDMATLERWQKRCHKLKHPKGSFRRVDPVLSAGGSLSDTVYAEMLLPGGITLRFTSPLDPSFIKALL